MFSPVRWRKWYQDCFLFLLRIRSVQGTWPNTEHRLQTNNLTDEPTVQRGKPLVSLLFMLPSLISILNHMCQSTSDSPSCWREHYHTPPPKIILCELESYTAALRAYSRLCTQGSPLTQDSVELIGCQGPNSGWLYTGKSTSHFIIVLVSITRKSASFTAVMFLK